MNMLSSQETKRLVEKLAGKILGELKEDFKITKLIYDSRKVEPGAAFFCIPGEKTDGNQYIVDAIKSGASCIVTEQKHGEVSVPLILMPDVRQALADFSSAFFETPCKMIRMIGITGTNGKTTTTHLIEHILKAHGNRVGLIGTLGSRGPGDTAYGDAKHTTPQAPELQAMLRNLVDHNCSHVTMEISSHSLALKRVAGCDFAVACLTNITQDHLDFHKTMENYWKAKRILFESLNESSQTKKLAVINLDDALSNEFIKACAPSVKVLTYGFGQKADVHPLECSYSQGRSQIKLITPHGVIELSMRLVGQFNVYNAMAAVTICLEEGVPASTIQSALREFDGVPGRFESVSTGADSEPLCIVDYAHTPDGLVNVLKTAAALKKSSGKLICVFGCGGDRDPSKRPQMGEIAEMLADSVVVTSDNPRTEDPQEIIAHILSGIKRMKNIQVEPDRAIAIKLAVSQAKADDIILVAGKGHENYQLVMDKVLSFDDKVEVRKALEARLEKVQS